MKAKALGLSVLGLFLVTAGCGSTPAPERLKSLSSAIQNGTVDSTNKYPYVVGIEIQGQMGGGRCTGAIIAPNLVLTARHCVVNNVKEQVDCKTDTFPAPLSARSFSVTTNPQMGGRASYRSVTKVFVPQQTAFCGNDIALFILSSNIPATEATPITPAIAPLSDSKAYPAQLYVDQVGYGITSPNANDSGTRRYKEAVNVLCIPGNPAFGCDDAVTQGALSANDLLAGDGTCSGDSGSSALDSRSIIKGAPMTLGVLSRGGVSDDGKTCVGSIYTRTDVWSALIISAANEAAQAGGYNPPAWTTQSNPGTPTPDAGPGTNPSGNPATPGSGSKPLGDGCNADTDCATNNCAAPTAGIGFTCTQECGSGCPDGYGCVSGFCFAGAGGSGPGGTGSDPQANGAQPGAGDPVQTTTKTGCSVSRVADPGKPIPWKSAFFGLAALALLRRKRQG